MTAAEMIEARNKLWADAKKILDKADADKRTLTGDERAEYDRLEADIEKLGEQIGTAERKERAAHFDAEMSRTAGRRAGVAPPHQPPRGDMGEAFRNWLLKPTSHRYSADQVANLQACGINPMERSLSIGLSKRALAIGTATGGQELATWHDMADSLDRALKAYGGARELVKVLPTANGYTLPIPTINDTANVGAIVAESGAIATTPDPTTGSVSLGAFMYTSKAVQLSLQMVQDSVVDLTALVPDMLGERIGRILNQHITVGTGSGQPNGIFPRATASAVVVGGTVASPTFSGDNFIDLIHTVDPAYRNAPGVGFMMNDNILSRARKLKDNNGQYLWQPSLQMGVPDRLLGYPVYVNQDAPALAVNARIAAFGDYKRYTWREVMAVDFYRLDELYIMNGQIAFMALYRGDGNLINTSAVKTLAAPAS